MKKYVIFLSLCISVFIYWNFAIGAATEPNPRVTAVYHDVLEEVQANAWGVAIKSEQFNEYGLQVTSTGSAIGTVKCYGSKSFTEPTWASAASATNRYSAKQIINENTGGSLQGATGVAVAGTDIVNEYHINVGFSRWFNCAVSGYSTGTFYTTFIGRKD